MATYNGTSGNDSLVGGSGDDTLTGGLGNDTLDGSAGYNTAQYAGSEYDYIVTRLDDGGFSIRAKANTPTETDGTDVLRNVQVIQFLDGNTQRVLDDYSNLQASTNVVKGVGEQVTGQTFRGDKDWFQITGGQANQAVHVVFAGGSNSTLSLNTGGIVGENSNSPNALLSGVLSADGSLGVNVSNTNLSLNAVNNYRFTVLRDLVGTDASETLTAGTGYEYLDAGNGNDVVTGSSRSDYLVGGQGSDTLIGGGGSDVIIGGDGPDDRDVAVFAGRLSDYSVVPLNGNMTNPAQDDWWTLTNKASGDMSWVKGVEVLKFDDLNYTIDEYDTFTAADIQGRPSYAQLGQAITGNLRTGYDADWIAFDFGRDVVNRDTTLKVTVSLDRHPVEGKHLSFIDVSGSQLQFTDVSNNSTKSSFDFGWGWSGTQSYLIKGIQWGLNAEGGAFGGGQAFLRMTSDYANSQDATNPNQGAYSISVSKYREGTSGNDVLTTDGATATTQVDELAGLGGNDKMTGTNRSERFDGGAGNDTIEAGAGDDVLTGGVGNDSLKGEAGDDTFVVVGESGAADTFIGGVGTDTIRVEGDADLRSSTFDSVEQLQGTGSNRVYLTTAQMAGFTRADNVILSGANQTFSSLQGNYILEGTSGDDVLVAGDGDNVLRPFAGNNTVVGGAGNDTVVWERGWGTNWDQMYRGEQVLSSKYIDRSYIIQGSYDGGAGNDRLEFRIQDNLYQHWSQNWQYETPQNPYTIDLTQASVSGFESLGLVTGNFTKNGATYSWGPSSIYVTASQLTQITSLSGGSFVVKGGGSVDLSTLSLSGGATVTFDGDASYSVTGTTASDVISTNGGNDSVVGGVGNDVISAGAGVDTVRAGDGDDVVIISGKGSVTDVIDGGVGVDTLRVTGADVDLSGATLTGIEKIEANSVSLALTQTQYNQYQGNITGAAGLILKMTQPGSQGVSSLPAGFVGINGSEGADTITGGVGNDVLVGGAGDDLIDGGAGNDRIVGDLGDDTLLGGLGNDQLFGGSGNDSLVGNDGNDSLFTGAGVDVLRGGLGDDTLWLTDKSVSLDVLDGGLGIDNLVIGGNVDLQGASLVSIEGITGSGTVKLRADQLIGLQSISGVHVELVDTPSGSSNALNVLLSDGASIALPNMDPNLAGQAGLLGSKLDDTIIGSAQDDALWGGLGADRLDGQAGNDTLIGGSGVDTLVGGAGSDQFMVTRDEFNQASGGGFTFTVNGKDYSGGTSHYLYSDIIDGGLGTDTLSVQFANDNSMYLYREGSISNVENLSLDISSGWSQREFWISAGSLSALNSVSVIKGGAYDWARLAINIVGSGQNFAPTAITSLDGIRKVSLLGSFGDVDFSKLTVTGTGDFGYSGLQVWNADNIQLSTGDDALVVIGDNTFNVRAGGGNDRVAVQSVSAINGMLDGGEGVSDILDVSSLGYADITNATITGFETINQGSTTLLMTQVQANSLTLQGEGRKYIKSGGVVTLTSSNDNFTGTGTESVSGGRGNDSISTVKTAVFSGNFGDYDLQWQNGSYVVQHSRGTPIDGTDTLNNVLQISFADTTNPIKLDDNFNNFLGFDKHTFVNYQLDDGVDKRISARKDYNGDVDVFTTNLVPSSPFFIQGSTQNGDGWRGTFIDVATNSQLVFKSLVNGQQYWDYYSWMDGNLKWVPGFQTQDGFVPYQGGNVFFYFNVDGAIQNYAFTLKYLDDYLGSKDTLGQMDPLKGQIKGYIGDIADTDWIRTSLIKGTLYEFNLQGLGSGKGTLANPSLGLYDSQGRLVEHGFDLTTDAVGQDDKLVFRPTDTGTYYLQVKDTSGLYTGSWTLTQESLDTIAGNISTTARAEWSADKTFSVTSEVNKLGDQDWFRVWLDQGMSYEFHALGTTTAMGNTLGNPLLSLYSVTGNLLEVGTDFVGTDDRLVYQAPDAGWYFLSLGASGNTSKGTYTITGSSLKDDYGNTYSSAGVISVGTTVHGTISFNDDTDWLKVGLTAGQTYRIDLTSDNNSNLLDPLRDPLLVIRNAQGQVVAEADDFGTQLNARSYFTATTTGVYYLEAKSAFKFDVGAWALKVDLAPADDFASDLSLAISATPPANLGALTVSGQTPAVLSGEIGMPGDVDLFKVSLQAGTVYQIAAEGFAGHKGTLADPYVRLFNSSGQLVSFDDDDGSGTDAQFYVAPTSSGDYFIQVSTDNSKAMGTYQVSVAARNIAADEAASNVSTQALLTVGDTFKGNLLTHGDSDWVRIQLNQGQDYVFRAQGAASGQGTLLDPALELRAADGSLIGSYDNGLISKDAFTVFTPQASGTYYLVVKSGDVSVDTGTYTLVSRAPDDYSDSTAGAATLGLGQTLAGGIQWASGSFGVRAQDSLGLATDMDVDWFKIHANAGQVLSVTVAPTSLSSLSRPLVEIVSSDLSKRTIAIGDGLETSNGSAVATFKSAMAGDYYVRVIDGAGATGDYTINLAQGDASDEDRNGPVGLTLKTIAQGGVTTQNATIGLAGDSDSFTFQALAGHNYRVETLAVRDGTHAPLSGSHLSVDMTVAGVSGSTHIDNTILDRAPSTFEGAVFKANASGIATLSVSAAQDFQTGQYQVRVTDLGNGSDDHANRVSDVPKDSLGAVLTVMAGNDTATGEINSDTDVDLFAIQLTEGNVYDLSVLGFADGLGTLGEAGLKLLDAQGHLVSSGDFNAETGRSQLDVAVFESGMYYVAVSGLEKVLGSLGSYTLQSRVQDFTYAGPDDWAADVQTAAVVVPGRAVNGNIQYDIDHDWISANLSDGHTYVIDILGDGSGSGGHLKDGYLRVLDAAGNEVMTDDNSGAGNDARVIIQASATGTYYFDVSSRDGGLGDYTVRLRELYSGTADPLQSSQWYLNALHLPELQGQFSGAGVLIGMVDDGIDTSHPDLQSQIDFALSYDAVYKTSDGKNKIPYPTYPSGDFHGTAVAGIMVAAANNDTGIAGIAYEAEVASTRVKWSWNQIVDALGKQYQFDVSNNSWGSVDAFTDSFNDTTLTFAYQAIRHAVEDGRHGLGTVMVFSAGNSASYGANTNYSNFANAREVITVGAVQADGSAAAFSTPGANVLVSAYGVDLLTTDRHEPGLGLNQSSNYTNFSGTSAAAPVVSAVVALMLEANPNLGYRDVQEILAYSASHPAEQSWKENGAHNFNLGGLSFNDKLGFGVVNAYAAVQLAQTWTGHNTAMNEVVSSARAYSLHDTVSDSGTVYSRTFTLSGDMTVDHVELGIDLRHTRMGDLVIELISPNGTVSRLMDRPTVNPEQPYGLSGIDSNVPTHLLWDFSSVQYMGEKVTGDWTVQITDVRPEETGTIQSLSLRAYGSTDKGNDTYVFSDEGFVANGGLMGTLADEYGTDTLNNAMMLQSVTVDLAAHLMTSNGAFYRISDWTQIENVVTGAADDILTGNELNNLLSGRAGDDAFIGGLGNDTLDGGTGTDRVIYAGKRAEYNISYDAKTHQVHVVDNNSANGNDGNDTLINIETIKFSDQELSLSKTVGNRAPIVNKHFFDQPVKIGKGEGIDFELPKDIFVDPDVPVPQDPVAPAPADPSNPYAPVVLGDTIGEVKFAIVYLDQYNPSSDVAVAHVSCQLKTGVSLQDLHVATNHIEINGRILKDGSAIQVVNVTQDGVTTGFDIRVDASKLNANEQIESLQFALDFDPAKVNTDSVLVDLTSSNFGISNVFERKNPSLDNLDITVTREDGSNLPDWLSFDPITHKFEGTPPDNFQGQIKVLIQALDDFGLASSGVLKLQFGDNQAPVLQDVRAIEIAEDAPLLALGITQPSDPEGQAMSVTIDSTPVFGSVLKADGSVVKAGDILSASDMVELHYLTAPDSNGNAGPLSYTVTDAGGAVASSSVKIFVQAVNDAPRFGQDSKLIINYPGSDDIVLDLNKPTDLESTISSVTINELPVLGQVFLNGQLLQLGQVVNVADLSKVHFSLHENVNGPIGSIGLQATDDQGLSTTWHLQLEVKGTTVTTSGTAGDDTLYGSINADSLYGLGGNDTLVGNPGDDRLVGGTGNDSMSGGAGNDTLDGGSGDDTLNGGAGVDLMSGGPGNDTYLVDNTGDRVVETLPKGAGGVDTVFTSVNFVAPSNVENLTASDSGAINLTGNELDNVLAGNAQDNLLTGGAGSDTLLGGGGNDTLNGGDGIDKMAGGIGNDTYYVDSRFDVIMENAGEGTDTVYASTNYTLATNLENLFLLPGGDWSGAGNSLANRIVGNDGNNLLSGGLGADTLEGGLGNDIYVLSDNLDTIIDAGGIDTVRSANSIDLSRLPTIERAELIGVSSNTLTGNALDNELVGNSGDNFLDGGAGVDRLTGGLGGDGFFVGYNGVGKLADVITDFDANQQDYVLVDVSTLGVNLLQAVWAQSGFVSASSFVKADGAVARDTDDFFLLNTATGVLSFDSDGSGTNAAIAIARFEGDSYKNLTPQTLYLSV